MLRLRKGLPQRITFVMVNSAGIEVQGIAAALDVEISKNGGGFSPSSGLSGEIGAGWYYYDLTDAETDTPGPLSIRVNGGGAVQQNLFYEVETLVVGSLEFTYEVTDSVSSLPLEGVAVWVTTDVAGVNVIWQGMTDAFGVARDASGSLPYLPVGTAYFWRSKIGYSFVDPDAEIVS